MEIGHCLLGVFLSKQSQVQGVLKSIFFCCSLLGLYLTFFVAELPGKEGVCGFRSCAETTMTGFSVQTERLDTFVFCMMSHTSSVTHTQEGSCHC